MHAVLGTCHDSGALSQFLFLAKGMDNFTSILLELSCFNFKLRIIWNMNGIARGPGFMSSGEKRPQINKEWLRFCH